MKCSLGIVVNFWRICCAAVQLVVGCCGLDIVRTLSLVKFEQYYYKYKEVQQSLTNRATLKMTANAL